MKLFMIGATCTIASLLCTSTQSAIVIGGTRVVYPSNAKEITLQVKNDGDSPSLIQAWIDDGRADITPEKSVVPFIITPPVSRVDAKSGQSLRIVSTAGTQATNQETVYWLNVLDIPAKPEATTTSSVPENYLQIAIRSRIKLFYRPSSLSGKANDASKKLVWSISNGQLNCSNPTPFHISFSSIKTISANAKSPELIPEGFMLKPFENKAFDIKDLRPHSVIFTNVNDYGGVDETEIKLLNK